MIDDSIKNNILMGDKANYNYDLYKKSLEDVNLSEFINSLKRKTPPLLVNGVRKFQEGKNKE